MNKVRNVSRLAIAIIAFATMNIANADVINNDQELAVLVKNEARVDYFHSKLKLDSMTGTYLTNQPHTYKLYNDSTKALTLYCSDDTDSKACLFSINKAIARQNKMLTEESDSLRIMIQDPSDTLALLNILDIAPFIHGDYAIKNFVGNDEEPFGFSCVVNTKNIDERFCSLVIFFN